MCYNFIIDFIGFVLSREHSRLCRPALTCTAAVLYLNGQKRKTILTHYEKELLNITKVCRFAVVLLKELSCGYDQESKINQGGKVHESKLSIQ